MLNILEELPSFEVRLIQLDVTGDKQRAQALARIQDGQAGWMSLINNAGLRQLRGGEDIGLDEARQETEVNLYGLVDMIQLVAHEG